MSEHEHRALLERAQTIGESIGEQAAKGLRFLVLSHFDADGLAAAGIVAKALLRLGVALHVRIVRQLDEETLKSAFATPRDIIIFAELGSGYLDVIDSHHASDRLYIIDHHPVVGDPASVENHLNPNLFGYDGARDLSGAGTVYLAARTMGNNVDLAPLAVVGALGDMQDKNERRELTGLNVEIVTEAEKAGYLKAQTDLVFYGRETRPVYKALANTMNPFLPGLSGREDNCLSLFSSVKIPLKDGERWRTPADLTLEEKQSLISKIVEHLTSLGFSGETARSLIGQVYTLTREKEGTILRDAREFSATLNACGRMGKRGLGVAICLGDRGAALTEVEALIRDYKQTLARYMEWITQNREKIQILKATSIIRGEEYIDENMSGAISSMLSSTNGFDPDKALIVVTKPKEDGVKISARISQKLAEKRVNLGEILSALSKSLNGLGGGHNVAAGAKIPFEKLEHFLHEVDRRIAEQLGL